MHWLGHFSGLVGTLICIGCGAPTITQRPEIESVKTIAIVAVTSNAGLHESVDGDSDTFSFSEGLSALNALSKAAGGEDIVEADFGGTRLVEHAHKIFKSELETIRGWKVVPTNDVMAHQGYAEFASYGKEMLDSMGGIGKLAQAGYVTYPGMVATDLNEGDVGRSIRAATIDRCAKLAKSLDVDAVAVIQLSNGYVGNDWLGAETGTTWPDVGLALHVIDVNGVEVVNTGSVGPKRGVHTVSDDGVTTIGGSIPFNDSTEAMYRKCIAASAKRIRDQIAAELSE